MNLPSQYAAEFMGQSKTLEETAYYFTVALVLSVVFMYLILAAQFESWMNPLAILSALPVTIPFGLLSLVLFRTPMDLYAMFGLFMLVGIVKKNGILQVDKTNELRRGGMNREQAILEALRCEDPRGRDRVTVAGQDRRREQPGEPDGSVGPHHAKVAGGNHL